MSVQKGPCVSQSQLGHLQRSCGGRVITTSAAMDQSACPEPPAQSQGRLWMWSIPAVLPGEQTLPAGLARPCSEMNIRALPGTGSPQPTDPTPTSPTDLSAEDKQTQEVIDGSLWKALIARPQHVQRGRGAAGPAAAFHHSQL